MGRWLRHGVPFATTFVDEILSVESMTRGEIVGVNK
jgi:hypothetical protein